MRFLLLGWMSVMVILIAGFRVDRARGGDEELRAGGRGSPHPAGGVVDNSPYFEFAPVDGGLGTTPCACATITGAKGEALTVTRASTASCLKGDSFISGIVPGDMALCTSGQARLAYADSTSHQLGLWSEKQRINADKQSEDFSDVAWVQTATVTANTTLSPRNTLTMDTLTDGSAIAVLGVSQVVSTANATKMVFSCFVQASTQDAVTISLTGTGNGTGDCSSTFTSLSTTTIRRVWCGSTTAYTGAVTAVTGFIGVGDEVGDTGDVIVWGCQLETTALARTGDPVTPTSYISTTTAAQQREADNISYALPAPYASPTSTVANGCTKVCMRPAYQAVGVTTVQPGYLLATGANGRAAHSTNGNTILGWFDGSNDVGYPALASNWSASSSKCWRSTFTGSTRVLDTTGAAGASGAYDGTWGIGSNQVQIGWGTSGGSNDSPADGIISQVQFDPTSTTKCTAP